MPAHRTVLMLVCAAALALSSCGTADPAPPADTTTGAAAVDGPIPDPDVGQNRREVTSLAPRLLLSHAGGLALLDAKTGAVLRETAHPAFLRLSGAGDERHVVVADGDTFRLYDTGVLSEPHGDHAHHYEVEPGLTTRTFDAPKAGHVVPHQGRTTLFADGTGEITTLDTAAIADPDAEVTARRTEHAHHGVAIELSDGTLATTQGTKDERNTVQVRDGDRVLAQTTECPGVHGEAAASPTPAGDVLVFGCTDGPVVYRDGAFHDVPVADAYARTGNLAGHDGSPIVLGDYKVDKDAQPVERPTRVSLIDTATDELRLVELGSSYWFRSLARGPRAEGLVLTYDGRLQVIDVEEGRVTDSIEVISPWQEKDDWQQPGPAVQVAGTFAYVSDVENSTMTVVDLEAMKVETRYDLPYVPVEFTVTTGRPGAPSTPRAGDHAGHTH